MLTIRFAHLEDTALLATMIRELAEYERLGHEASFTEEDLARDGFGHKAKFRALVAEWDGYAAGYACFFEMYSTYQGRAGLFLEDMFVRPQFRKKGIGKALIARSCKTALDENYFCIRWEVLRWNTPAIDFYRSLDAVFVDERKSALLTGDTLKAAAQDAL